MKHSHRCRFAKVSATNCLMFLDQLSIAWIKIAHSAIEKIASVATAVLAYPDLDAFKTIRTVVLKVTIFLR